MRKFHLLLYLLVFVVPLSCALQAPVKHHYIAFLNAQALQQFLNRKTAPYPLLSAHRGGPMANFPENAIETFENATTYQPVIIEFDVSLTKDSVLAIMHDDKLDRTTTGTGAIAQYTYAQLQQFFLKDNNGKVTKFKIPTLKEVLKWGKNKVIFTIDIKKDVPYIKIIEAVRQTKSENNAILISYNANQAAQIHQLAPDLMISASVKSKADLERLNQMGVPNNKIVAFVGVTAAQKELYQYLHQQGISCILGTMGNLDQKAKSSKQPVYAQLVADGADILSTNELELAGQQLDAYRKANKMELKNINAK